MRFTTSTVLALLATTSSTLAQETVLGVYIFARHGDRTAKLTPPANLTDLGYLQVYETGTFYRNRYVDTNATQRIYNLNADLVKQSQITASAPVDTVLQNSAMAFLQALYPPVGNTLGSNTLRNGTTIQAPMDGYQLIPLQTVQTDANSENAAWLQGATNCANAQISSNNYFTSSEYMALYNSTTDFYRGVVPMVNRTFTTDATTFKNAYTIYDLLNVANIHNSSSNFPSADLLTPDVLFQLRTLADTHEYGLAYNASEPIRAITGSIIAGEVVNALNTSIANRGKSKQLNIQFGAYAGMQSFFGLANLTAASPEFFGVPDYASSLVWELVTNATNVSSTSWPAAEDISVRFLFANGSAAAGSGLTEFPLFGGGVSPLPWTQFTDGMGKFSINGQKAWCQACGNSTGVCSAEELGGDSGGDGGVTSSSSSSGGNGGMSNTVAGVIGAFVTLAVVLGSLLALMLLGGFRLVSKKRLSAANGNGSIGGVSQHGKA